MLFARNIIDFHSFYVALHFIVTLEPVSRNIIIRWFNRNGNENCIVNYTINWEDGRREGSGNTTDNYFVIDSLAACVTFEVSVSVKCSESGTVITYLTNVTTLPEGKWHFSIFVYILHLTPSVYNILTN